MTTVVRTTTVDELLKPLTEPPPVEDPELGPDREPRWRLRAVLSSRITLLVGIGVVALLARLLAIDTAYDIFIDEATYTNVALNVAHGHGVTLYGQTFDLHPPAAFGLYGLSILVFGFHGTTETVLFELRHVAAVLGAASCVVTFILVDRAVGRWIALLAALFLALDPLAISYDSRVMLEPPAQLAAVTCFALIAIAIGSPSGSTRRSWWFIAAGVAGATTLCTKETFGLVVVVAFLLLFVSGWVIARREALVVMVLTATGYVVSVLITGLTSGFGVWWHSKSEGVLRLVGASQISGFNSSQVHVSLISRILADGSTLGVPYVVLAGGSLASLGLLWRLRPWRSERSARDTREAVTLLCALWTVAAGAYLAYATLFGTLEEQMYYILLLPAIISAILWLTGFFQTHSVGWRRVVTAVVCLALLFDSIAWVNVHTHQDDEYRRLLRWESVNVPPTAVIAATEYLSQFLLTRGIIGQWNTLPQLKAHHVDYIIVGTALTDEGYGIATPSLLRVLNQRAKLVFEANGVSDGSLRVYDIEALTRGSK
jgi:4-amino-4-deoxy-L-arabinose transferase-like glycosyltransferase